MSVHAIKHGVLNGMWLESLPVCRTVITDAPQMLLGMPPLDLEVQRRALLFQAKRKVVHTVHGWVDESFYDLDVKEIKNVFGVCH